MAPRKDASGQAPSAFQSQQDASSDGIEDFELPRLLVTQLAKSNLSPDVKLDDDTITALVKGSTVFINYLTSAAQDIASSRTHKTISGADVLRALENLEFGAFVPALQSELEVFRQGNKAQNKSKAGPEPKGKGKETSKISSSTSGSVGAIRGRSENISNGIMNVDEEMHDASDDSGINAAIEAAFD